MSDCLPSESEKSKRPAPKRIWAWENYGCFWRRTEPEPARGANPYVLEADADRLAEALRGLLSITVDPTLLAPEQREEVKGARAALAAYEGGGS